ncbi:MAG TPA: hypothetical protein VKH64_00315 [Candidatus Binatia bacterium]|nr:hypothetical protein [Candidatus Binatia bacterium]
MKKYGYKTFALGGILAGSLIAAPAAFAHGGRYSSSDDTSESYAWSGDTSSRDMQSSDRNSFAPTNEESPQFSNDSNPAPIPDQTAMNEQLQRDQDRLAEDMRNGASDEQLAEDRSAIDQDRQALDTVAFNGDGTVTVIPGS